MCYLLMQMTQQLNYWVGGVFTSAWNGIVELSVMHIIWHFVDVDCDHEDVQHHI